MVSFAEHLEALDPARRAETERLDAIFRDVTGWSPEVWQAGIGYGRYAYRYDSGRSGEFFATGFKLRARDVSLHILPGYSEFPAIAERLGPHTRGKSCWYVKSVDRVDESALRDLISAGIEDLRTHWPVQGT